MPYIGAIILPCLNNCSNLPIIFRAMLINDIIYCVRYKNKAICVGRDGAAGAGVGSGGMTYLVDDDDGAAFAFMPPLPSNT